MLALYRKASSNNSKKKKKKWLERNETNDLIRLTRKTYVTLAKAVAAGSFTAIKVLFQDVNKKLGRNIGSHRLLIV